MKKILLTLLFCLFATVSYSDHNGKPFKFIESTVPVWCGIAEDVEEFLSDHNYKPVTISFGKVGAREDGEIVFASMIYINMNKNQLIPVMIAPEGFQSCLMYVSFDLSFNHQVLEEFKEYIK